MPDLSLLVFYKLTVTGATRTISYVLKAAWLKDALFNLPKDKLKYGAG